MNNFKPLFCDTHTRANVNGTNTFLTMEIFLVMGNIIAPGEEASGNNLEMSVSIKKMVQRTLVTTITCVRKDAAFQMNLLL